MSCPTPAAPRFLEAARCLIKPPAILTRRPSLTPAGLETTRLEVDDSVVYLAVLADGLVAGDGMGRVHWLKIVG